MKIAINTSRIIVGLLFIFSGLIKANDPHGLSYKMQEFFEIWGVAYFNSWTLWLSVLMNAFEIIAGFALLLGWQTRLFSWLLLLLILFFTFLTGYTYVTGKPSNCGCFGDCIPITSRVSFYKDVALTALIVFLFAARRYIRPLLSRKTGGLVMVAVIVAGFAVQWYTLKYLPVFDCLPYRVHKNIARQMQLPGDAIPDSTVITFVYRKDGKEVEFTADNFPADFASPPYEFLKRYDKLIRKGKNNEPPIKGFILSGASDIDSTQYVLSRPKAILLFCEDFTVPVSDWQRSFAGLYQAARDRNIPVFAVTTRLDEAVEQLARTPFRDITIFKCDFTAIRTAARANPTAYLLEAGTVAGKQPAARFHLIQAKLELMPVEAQNDSIPAVRDKTNNN